MEKLIESLKHDIIEQLNLGQQYTVTDLNEDEPLFGEGMGLDSIDALEIIVMLEKNYGVKISNPEEGRSVLKSIRTIAEFISTKKL